MDLDQLERQVLVLAGTVKAAGSNYSGARCHVLTEEGQ